MRAASIPIAVAALVFGAGCLGSNVHLSFDCQQPPPPEAMAVTPPPTTFDTGRPLDEAKIRAEAPELAATLDECVALGHAEIHDDRDRTRAREYLGEGDSFAWNGSAVRRTTYA